jgi:hypothetical protein
LVYIMIDMVRIHYKLRNKRLLAWSIIPICLFLVSLGIRVPNLSRLHSSPKPTPRAVIENVSKAGKFAMVKHVMAIELFNSVPEVLAPQFIPARFRPVIHRLTRTVPPQIAARAPPVVTS